MLGLVFILMFFSWVGFYPGKVGVLTQSGWGAAFGSFTSDVVWEKVARFSTETYAPSIDLLLFFYVLLVLLINVPAVIVAALLPRGNQALRPILQPLAPHLPTIAPWRALGVAGITAFTFLLLALQGVWGFSLEQTVEDFADAQFKNDAKPAATGFKETPEEAQMRTLRRGMIVSQFGLQTTLWFRLAVLAHLLALIGAGLDLWLDRRGQRPLPRADLMW